MKSAASSRSFWRIRVRILLCKLRRFPDRAETGSGIFGALGFWIGLGWVD